MAYNEEIAARIRQALAGTKNLVEKKMFGGIAFMVNDKMCIGVNKDDIIMRCDPERTEEFLAKKHTKPFEMTGKQMKGWFLVNEGGIKNKRDFEYWINTALDANKSIPVPKSKKIKK